MSAEVAEAGKNQRLLVDGRRANQEPRTAQATRRETRGVILLYIFSFRECTYVCMCVKSGFHVGHD